jgi:hypothetical protein
MGMGNVNGGWVNDIDFPRGEGARERGATPCLKIYNMFFLVT